MPARRSTRKYSTEQNVDFGMRVLGVLAEAPEALEIKQIQASDLILNNLTSQKIAKVLAELSEMGLVLKSKNNRSGKMNYKARGVCEAQGYNIEEMVYQNGCN